MRKARNALALKSRVEAGGGNKKGKGGPSRRDSKINRMRAEKKKLRTRWLQAEDHEKEDLKYLYEDLKAKHRKLVREQRRLERFHH